MIGGDLFVPFLDRALTALRLGGKCGFLCSDRWRFMAFAEAFRQKWLPNLDIESEWAMAATDAFVNDVNSYPMILIASKRPTRKKPRRSRIVRKGTFPGRAWMRCESRSGAWAHASLCLAAR